MSNIKTYITYFDDAQISEYNLKEDEDTILFKGNDTSYPGDSINYLNIFYCELCTMYYVWKNNLKSDYIVFKQYRRPFDWESVGRLPKDGEVICYRNIVFNTQIFYQYAMCHGKNRLLSLLRLFEKKYGKDSDIYDYFTYSNIMFTNNSMVLRWDDFCKMCEFVFDVINEIDKYYNLNYKYDKYMKNAKKYTEDGRYDYQTHWMAYIGERIVSCYILKHMNPITIPRLEGNGFFKPYKKEA